MTGWAGAGDVAGHRLVLVDRGAEHQHRWTPTCGCGCGWTGVHRRRKPDAVEEFRQMKDGAESRRRDRERGQEGRRNRRMPARPKPLTLLADLPDELR